MGSSPRPESFPDREVLDRTVGRPRRAAGELLAMMNRTVPWAAEPSEYAPERPSPW